MLFYHRIIVIYGRHDVPVIVEVEKRIEYRAIEHTLIDIVKLLWSQLRVNKIIQSFFISIIPRLSP